jgi:Periplasmic binding protein
LVLGGRQQAQPSFSRPPGTPADAARTLASVPSNKKVVLFTDSEPDAVVERPLYMAAFTTDGLDVVGDYTFPAGTTNFSSFIADAQASGAQLLAGQMTPADGVALWKQLKSVSFHPQAAFLAEASDADSWWRSLGGVAQDTLSEGYGAEARHRRRSSRRSPRRSAKSTREAPARRARRWATRWQRC